MQEEEELAAFEAEGAKRKLGRKMISDKSFAEAAAAARAEGERKES
jgi:hypothetical protein